VRCRIIFSRRGSGSKQKLSGLESGLETFGKKKSSRGGLETEGKKQEISHDED